MCRPSAASCSTTELFIGAYVGVRKGLMLTKKNNTITGNQSWQQCQTQKDIGEIERNIIEMQRSYF